MGFNDLSAARNSAPFRDQHNLGIRLQLTLLDPEVPRPLAEQLEHEAEGVEEAQVNFCRITCFFAVVVLASLVLLTILPATRIFGVIILIVAVTILGARCILFHVRSRRKLTLLCAQAERWIRPARIIDVQEADFVTAGDCAICLQGLADWSGFDTEREAVDILQLRCGHRFHSKCLTTWFNVMIACPVCRSHGWGASRLRVVPNTWDADQRHDPDTGASSAASQDEDGLASMSRSLLQEVTVDQASTSSTGNH